MMARLLRGILLFEFIGFALLFPTLADRLGAGPAALALPVIVLAAQAVLLAPGFALAVLRASPRPAGVGGPRPSAMVVEWLAGLAAFALVMPFAGLWMGSDAVGRLPAGRRPVLLVHGYMCNRGFWWWFRRRLRAKGHAVATLDLETPISDIDTLADGLLRRIDALLAETGADRVLLVTHSMGGLVARAALRKAGPDRVARFVTLSGPHHGTLLAHAGIGRNAAQMRPQSPWLAALNAAPPAPIPTLTIWSTGDEIVVPQDSSRLAGAREIVVPAIGHVAMGFSPRVLELVAADLARDAGAPPLTDADHA